jgi:hypothetical protein
MNGEESSDLRIAAIALWHYQRMEAGEVGSAASATASEQARRVERFRAELQRIVGEREDISLKINGGCVEAEVEDLRFIAYEFLSPKQEQWTLVTLLGRCPVCGVETMSKPFYNLAGLGKMLENFEPSYSHLCNVGKASYRT